MIFVKKGDKPLTEAQIHKRTQRFLHLEMPAWKRERAIRTGGTDMLNEAMTQVELDTDSNRSMNAWNASYWSYVEALRIVALPAPAGDREVERPVYDDEGNQTGTEIVVSPDWAEYESQQVVAQAIVDGADQTILDYYDEQNPAPVVDDPVDGLPAER